MKYLLFIKYLKIFNLKFCFAQIFSCDSKITLNFINYAKKQPYKNLPYTKLTLL